MGACVSACARVCVSARAWMHACSELYKCVCGCMPVEEAGAGERGRECESDYFIFIVILSVPS